MNKLNLLPEEYVKQRLQYRVDMLCVLLFGLVMVSIMTAEAISGRQVQETQVTHAGVVARFNEAAQFMNDFFVLQREKNELVKKAEFMTMMTDRVPRSYLLAMIANYCPEQITFGEVSITEKIIVPEKEEDDKKRRTRKEADDKKKKEIQPPKTQLEIRLNGLSEDHTSIGTLIDVFKINPLVQDVDLKYSREKRTADVTMRDFEIVLLLKETNQVVEILQDPKVARSLAVPDRSQDTTLDRTGEVAP